MEVSKSGTNTKVEQEEYHNQMYRINGETEQMSGGHVILIGRDNARDHLIMSGDEPGGLEMDLGCHGYDNGGVGEKDKEVININDEPSFSDHVMEGVVHESLEGGRRVGEPKKHDGGFEEAFVDDEGSFTLVTIFDMDIVVSSMDIKFGDDLGIF